MPAGQHEVGAGYEKLCLVWVESALHNLDAATTVVYSLKIYIFSSFKLASLETAMQAKQSVTSEYKTLHSFELWSLT